MSNHRELTPNEARQGRKAPMVRRILVASLAAAAIAVAILAYFLTQ